MSDTSVKLALYKGPPTTAQRKIAHNVTKAVMTIADLQCCPWSHVELVINDWSYSSTALDVMTAGPRAGKVGGMRIKQINFDPKRWDLYPIKADPHECHRRFMARMAISQGYDWPAAAFWAIPLIHPRNRADNCLEAVAYAIGHPTPSDVTFRELLGWGLMV